MQRVRDGDSAAFRTLFEKYSSSLARYCGRFVGNLARGEELSQDAFVQMFQARERWEPRARVSTWIYTIAHNLCLNEIRRAEHRGKPRSLDAAPEDGGFTQEIADPAARPAEEVAAGGELEVRLRDLLADLPAAQRSALVLSRCEGLRYQEIAEVLGCSEQAVKSLVFRATQRLKEGLKEYVDEP